MAAAKKKLFVRREIWSLERTKTWDPITLAYAKAIHAMQQRHFPDDQTSYRYQAFMHGTNDGDGGGPDGVWNMCQHQTWFFLPWHRMYILWFEHIVRDVVRSQNGPANWALPYWNWQANRSLPPAFREHNLPASAGGGPNPLFRGDRFPQINAGNPMAPAVVDASAANATIPFAGGAAGAFGFGGGVRNNPSHFGAGLTGRLEQQPHNNVHVTIGGIMMSAASPLDPIFWLHHANVDRLWSRWLRLGGGRANPAQPHWRDQAFDFYKAAGQRVTQHPKNVTSTPPLGYRYDDDPPPAAAPITSIVPESAAAALQQVEALNVVSPEPQELGTSGPLTLGRGASSTEIELAAEPAQALTALAQPNTAPSTVALIVEGIKLAEAGPPTYEVYLNLDDPGEGGEHDSPHFVGFLEFFGADHEHGEHAEHDRGVTRAFDITSLVHQLQDAGTWDPARARVSFVPARLFEDEESGELLAAPIEGDPKVQVGAVRIVSE
jgi:Common central domain of tyrosinase